MKEKKWDPQERLLRLSEVRSMVGYSRSSIYLMIAHKKFPAPLKINGTNSGSRWRLSEILDLIASGTYPSQPNDNPENDHQG